MNSICQEWFRNPLVNPVTGRKIKKDGPVYKKLERKCKPKGDTCQEWLRNPLVNPVSGRKIKKDGPVYKKLERKCVQKRPKQPKNPKQPKKPNFIGLSIDEVAFIKSPTLYKALDLLGLSSLSTQKERLSTFRRWSLIYHPDKSHIRCKDFKKDPLKCIDNSTILFKTMNNIIK